MSKTAVQYGKPICLRLDPDLHARLDQMSVKIGEPKATIMRICLRIGMNAISDLTQRDLSVLVARLTTDKSPAEIRRERYPGPIDVSEEIRMEDKPPKKKAG